MGRAIGLLAFIASSALAFAQVGPISGDEAIAGRYLAYALDAAEEGRWEDAETVLERAADFASISSDLSYYLGLARSRRNRPVGAVLECLNRALEAGRWRVRRADDARILQAECLIRLRSYSEALSALSSCADAADVAALRLRALRGLGDAVRFDSGIKAAFAGFPRDPRFVGLLFESLGTRIRTDEQHRLVDTAIRRLPYLLDADPSLAVSAAPFIGDVAERRRLVAAYRAAGGKGAASIAAALDLGLIDDDAAVAELFSQEAVDVQRFLSVYRMLRGADARKSFASSLAAYSGVVQDDFDGDGFPESVTRYERGGLMSFAFDADQDGIPEWSFRFSDGLPVSADVALSFDAANESVPARPASRDDRTWALVKWERYPYVSSISLGGETFSFAPAAFPFSPIRLDRLLPDAETRIPRTDAVSPRLTERSLYSFASSLERPGHLARGTVERIEYANGVPLRSRERLGGIDVGISEFANGMLVLRKFDLDADGRVETIERYEGKTGALVSVETDFDGDGVFEKDFVR